MTTKICQESLSMADGEFTAKCTLPINHGGECNFIDDMGLCFENEDCRAYYGIWARQNAALGLTHNHL